jgi:hypothetical protein
MNSPPPLSPDRISRAQAKAQAISDARSTDVKIATATRVVMKNLDMVESEAHIKLFALARLFCLYLVEQLQHLPPHAVRKQAFVLFRKTLLDVMEKASLVTAQARKANDNAAD